MIMNGLITNPFQSKSGNAPANLQWIKFPLKTNNTFIELFLSQSTNNEWSEIYSLIADIERLKERAENLNEENWNSGLIRVSPFRLKSSSSLQRGDLFTWQQANNWISEKAQQNPIPKWEDVEQINRILNSDSKTSVIRTDEVYLGPWKACPALELLDSISYLRNEVLNNKDLHPLIHAALVQYWIVSIHPFRDANGRTAILTADWILASNGYLPQSFRTRLDAIVAYLPERKTTADSKRAIRKILNNVKFSYETFLNNPYIS